MKTPEEMAEDYATTREAGHLLVARRCYLAGFREADLRALGLVEALEVQARCDTQTGPCALCKANAREALAKYRCGKVENTRGVFTESE